MPGAFVRDPTQDEVMRKTPDMKGHSGYKGPSRLALASIPPCIPPTFFSAVVLVCPAADSYGAC